MPDAYLGGSPTFDEGGGASGLPINAGLPQQPQPPQFTRSNDAYQGLGYSSDSDPFAYSNFSLLTPWTQALPSLPTGGGSGFANVPGFSFGDLNYSPSQARGAAVPGAFNAPTPFQFDAYSAPQQFSYGSGVPNAQAAFQGVGGVPTSFQPDRFSAPSDFVAPTLNETNDPGYALRLKEAQQAIQNRSSAQGIRGGDVMQALERDAQDYASGEYGNVWNRAFNTSQANFANRQGAFQTDTQAQMAARAQQAAVQQQGYEQAQGRFASALAAQNQGFGQALSTEQLNEGNRQNAAQLNWAIASGQYDRNAANALSAYQATNNAQLGAESLNTQADIANGRLGWDVASGSWDRNYGNALQQWQIMNSQAQGAASASAAGAQRDYANTMGQYQTAYGIFNANQDNQFNRLYALAGLGAGAANSASGAAQNNANTQAGNTSQAANANAAGRVANGSTWANVFSNLGDTFGGSILAASPYGGYNAPSSGSPGGYPYNGVSSAPGDRR